MLTKNDNITLLPQHTLTNSKIYLNKKPAYIFHHFLKCGGSSLVYSLKFWFNLVYDHLVDPKKINEFIHNKYDLEIINSDTCIVGHFAYDGIYLFQRYPELLKNDKIKVFTFIREPLDFYVSFYYYSKNQGRLNNISLVDFLESNRDLLAYYLPCD